MKARARFVKPAWTISVRRQCELLTVNRGQLYYAPKEERPENLEMMRLMDKHLIDHPTEGVLSMVAFLGIIIFMSIPSGYAGCLDSWAIRRSIRARIYLS